jgi:hypothetical protein
MSKGNGQKIKTTPKENQNTTKTPPNTPPNTPPTNKQTTNKQSNQQQTNLPPSVQDTQTRGPSGLEWQELDWQSPSISQFSFTAHNLPVVFMQA